MNLIKSFNHDLGSLSLSHTAIKHAKIKAFQVDLCQFDGWYRAFDFAQIEGNKR